MASATTYRSGPFTIYMAGGQGVCQSGLANAFRQRITANGCSSSAPTRRGMGVIRVPQEAPRISLYPLTGRRLGDQSKRSLEVLRNESRNFLQSRQARRTLLHGRIVPREIQTTIRRR